MENEDESKLAPSIYLSGSKFPPNLEFISYIAIEFQLKQWALFCSPPTTIFLEN